MFLYIHACLGIVLLGSKWGLFTCLFDLFIFAFNQTVCVNFSLIDGLMWGKKEQKRMLFVWLFQFKQCGFFPLAFLIFSLKS